MTWVTFGSSLTFQLSVTDACPGVAVAPVIPGEIGSLEAVANDAALTPAVMIATSRTHASAPTVSARHRARTSFCSILSLLGKLSRLEWRPRRVWCEHQRRRETRVERTRINCS